jgi:hypothetical protein
LGGEKERKIKMHSGEIELRFKGSLIKNRQGKFKANSIIRKIYEKLIPKRIEDYMIDVYSDLYDFHDDIKAALEIHQF